jgi:hypothetical protein
MHQSEVDKNLCRKLEYYRLDLRYVAFFAVSTKNTLNCYFNNSWNSLFLLFPQLLAIIGVSIMPLKMKVCSVTVQKILLHSDSFFVVAQDVVNMLQILHKSIVFYILCSNKE